MAARSTNSKFSGPHNVCTDACKIDFRTGCFSDLSLSVGIGVQRHTFRVHQIIVCRASSVIRKLLAAEESNIEHSILLPDSKPRIMQNILDFIYFGKGTIMSSDMEDFLFTAKALDIKGKPIDLVDDKDDRKTHVMRQYRDVALRAAVTMTQLHTIVQKHIDPHNKSATTQFPVPSPRVTNSTDIQYTATTKPTAAVPSSRKGKAAAVKNNSVTPPPLFWQNTTSSSILTAKYVNEMESDESDGELHIDETREEEQVPMDYCEVSMTCNEPHDLRVFPTTKKTNLIPDLNSFATSNAIKSKVPYSTNISRSDLSSTFPHNNLHNINIKEPTPSTSNQTASTSKLTGHVYQTKQKMVKRKSKTVKGHREKTYTPEALELGVLLAVYKLHSPIEIFTAFSIPKRTFFRHLHNKRAELGFINSQTEKRFDKSNSDPSTSSDSTSPSEYMELNPKETDSLRQLPNKITSESNRSDDAQLEKKISRLQSAVKKEPVSSIGSQLGVSEFSTQQNSKTITHSLVGKVENNTESKSAAITGNYLHSSTTGIKKYGPPGSKIAIVTTISPPKGTIIRLFNSGSLTPHPSLVSMSGVSSTLKVDMHTTKK